MSSTIIYIVMSIPDCNFSIFKLYVLYVKHIDHLILSLKVFHFCCSEGIMIFPPNFAENSGEKYEGQWRDGKMSGYGKLR